MAPQNPWGFAILYLNTFLLLDDMKLKFRLFRTEIISLSPKIHDELNKYAQMDLTVERSINSPLHTEPENWITGLVPQDYRV